HPSLLYFFYTHTATPKTYPLSLHDALRSHVESQTDDSRRLAGQIDHELHQPPKNALPPALRPDIHALQPPEFAVPPVAPFASVRSEEHTSELQSRSDLVCRLLLEKKNRNS